ncbi:MAG: hypothetical protein V3R81_00960 [Gammaproteobacteria bacterium]
MKVHVKRHRNDAKSDKGIMRVYEYMEEALRSLHFDNVAPAGSVSRLVETLAEKGILNGNDIGYVADEKRMYLELIDADDEGEARDSVWIIYRVYAVHPTAPHLPKSRKVEGVVYTEAQAEEFATELAERADLKFGIDIQEWVMDAAPPEANG